MGGRERTRSIYLRRHQGNACGVAKPQNPRPRPRRRPHRARHSPRGLTSGGEGIAGVLSLRFPGYTSPCRQTESGCAAGQQRRVAARSRAWCSRRSFCRYVHSSQARCLPQRCQGYLIRRVRARTSRMHRGRRSLRRGTPPTPLCTPLPRARCSVKRSRAMPSAARGRSLAPSEGSGRSRKPAETARPALGPARLGPGLSILHLRRQRFRRRRRRRRRPRHHSPPGRLTWSLTRPSSQ